MPLPDESRSGRASQLIKRFQAVVDSAGEKPLTVSSAFAAPARPRPRASVEASGEARKDAERRGTRVWSGKDVVDPDSDKDKPLFFRSAGLDEKPSVLPVEQQGRQHAKEVFPDMREASAVGEAAEREASALKEHEVGQPSAAQEESAPEPSQETQDPPTHPSTPTDQVTTHPSLDIPPPVSAPVPGSTDLRSSTSPTSSPPPTAEKREGLSRPPSQAAAAGPPTTDDPSPPPTPAPASASAPVPVPAPAPAPTSSTPSRPTRTPPSTFRPLRATTLTPSPTPRRTSTSPTTSRLTAPTASSLAKSVSRPAWSPRRGAGGAMMTRQGSGGTGGASSPMRKSLSATSNSSAGAGTGAGKATSSVMTRSTSSSTSSSASSSTLRASPSASPRLGSPAAGGRSPAPLKVARTGRIGLAGAHSTRPASSSSPTSKPTQSRQAGKEEEDDIPVFPSPSHRGFLGPGTSRPIGKIGVPVVRNERGEVEAVGKAEVERAGEEARAEREKERAKVENKEE